jgi:hypothetical protein
MAERSEDHMTTIGFLKSNFSLIDRNWLNWRLGEPLRWKVETAGREGRRVECEKLAHPKL